MVTSSCFRTHSTFSPAELSPRRPNTSSTTCSAPLLYVLGRNSLSTPCRIFQLQHQLEWLPSLKAWLSQMTCIRGLPTVMKAFLSILGYLAVTPYPRPTTSMGTHFAICWSSPRLSRRTMVAVLTFLLLRLLSFSDSPLQPH